MNNTAKTTPNYVWDFLREHNIADDIEMNLVTRINGYTVKALNDILYVRTGYHDIEQYAEHEL